MDKNPFSKLQSGVSQFLESRGLQNIENPLTQLIRQSLQDMDFVTLDEFETQRQVLMRLRDKVKELERRVAELESAHKA